MMKKIKICVNIIACTLSLIFMIIASSMCWVKPWTNAARSPAPA